MDIRECAKIDQRELRLTRAITGLTAEMEECKDERIRESMKTSLSYMESCLKQIRDFMANTL